MIPNDELLFDVKKTTHDALTTIRKESLDIYNRLHSIQEDIAFVNRVKTHYHTFPLLPNLRCGAWYTDPTIATDTPAYFKSTDGHFGNWSFNLRRANLHLLPLIAKTHGVILVDSTRAGKRMPDALSKTVPIWCAVVNRAILMRRMSRQRLSDSEGEKNHLDTNLYTPPGVVSAQEHDQISQKLHGWAVALADSSFDLPLDLAASLRPFWITPTTTTLPEFDLKPTRFLPIVCLSASKQVEAGMERRTAGYAYVQGSGDDHELWGMGLTPPVFWRLREQLLSCPRASLGDLIKQILSERSIQQGSVSSSTGTQDLLKAKPIMKIKGRLSLALCSSSDTEHVLNTLRDNFRTTETTYILLDSFNFATRIPIELDVMPSDRSSNARFLHLGGSADSTRSRSHFLHNVLPKTMKFIWTHLSSTPSQSICIIESVGDAEGPGAKLDIGVGVVLAAIQLYFGDDGELRRSGERGNVDKRSIRTRLEWIIESNPQANPSRATLKRVNEYLLTPSVYLRR